MFLVRDVGHPAAEPIVFVFCSSHHRPGTVDHQRTKINITAFTNTEQAISVSVTVLLGGDAYRGRHLPTLLILPGIAHRGDHGRGCHRTDTTQRTQMLRCHQTVLRHQTADLVGLGRSLCHQLSPDAVRGLNILLFNTLDRCKAHVRSAHCFTNRLSVLLTATADPSDEHQHTLPCQSHTRVPLYPIAPGTIDGVSGGASRPSCRTDLHRAVDKHSLPNLRQLY